MDTQREIVTLADAGRAFGVSRQAIEQAIARDANPPVPAAVLGTGQRFYDRDDLDDWWHNRRTRWTETRAYSRVARRQVNLRITDEQLEQIDALRVPGQMRATIAAEIFSEGLAARLARSATPRERDRPDTRSLAVPGL